MSTYGGKQTIGVEVPVPGKTEKMDRSFVRDRVLRTLREWILSGILEPGEKIKDSQLAEALGVSKMPVREAFLRLEAEGLIETSANRWTRVSEVDADQAKNFYPILRPLESVAIELAWPHLQEADLEAMTEQNEHMAAALESDKPTVASEADLQFHEVFLSKCGNPTLIQIVRDLRAKLRRVETAYFEGSMTATQSAAEHQEILSAIESRDLDRARRAVEANWDESLRRILRRFEK